MPGSVLASKEAYEKHLNDSFAVGDEEFDNLFKAAFSPELEMIFGGQPRNFDDMYNSLKGLRTRIASSKVKVLYFLRDGNIFAERHSVESTGKDGKITIVEAYCFGEADEQGRIRKVDEAVVFP
jgi:hypothetical protein